jgi:DnaD family protein
MFLELLKNGKLNKKVLIAENYKNLGLNESQYAIISLVLEFDKVDRRVSTPVQLAEFMTLSVPEIEHELNDLINKSMLKIDVTSKKHNLDFTPLYNKLAVIFQNNMIHQMMKLTPEKLVEEFFDVKLNNIQISALNDFKNQKKSPTFLLDLLISHKYKNVDEFISYIKNLKTDDNVEIIEYDWLRNS